MKNNRLNQFLFALILSLGILFGHTSMVLAEGEDLTEESTESVGNPSTSEETPVVDETPDAVPASVLEFVPDQGNLDTQAIIDQVQNSYADSSDDYVEDVTKEDAIDAVNSAELSEIGTGVIAIPAGGETSEEIIGNEAVAVSDDIIAKETIDQAEEIMHGPDDSQPVQSAEEAIDDYADKTDDALDSTSGIEVIESEYYLVDSEIAKYNAENAEYHSEAVEEARRAERDYNNSQKLYSDAESAVQAAEGKRAEAEAALEAARAEYEQAVRDAQDVLKEGSEKLDDAVERTYLAMIAASDYYNAALEEEETAISERDAALDVFNQNRQDLEDAIKALGEAFGGTTKEVLQNTGETVATGIGLSVSDLIADYFNGVVEEKEGLILVYKGEIIDAEKTLAVNLQERLRDDAEAAEENKLSPGERELAVRTLTELIVRDHLREEDIEDASIVDWDIKKIKGIDISKIIDDGHKNGIFFSVSGSDGALRYYELQLGENGNLEYYPVEFAFDKVIQDYPDIDKILKDEAETKLRFGKSHEYIATNIVDDVPVTYDIYGVEYDNWLFGFERIIVAEENIGDKILPAVNKAIRTWSLKPLRDLGYITTDLSTIGDKGYTLYSYSIYIDDEAKFDSESYIHRYEEEGHLPSAEERILPLDALLEKSEQYRDEKKELIAELEKELDGDFLQELLRECVDVFVVDNQDKIAQVVLPSRHPESEAPGVLDIIRNAIGSNIDWSNFSLSNILGEDLSETLATIKSTAGASVLDIVKDVVGGIFKNITSTSSEEELSWDFTRTATTAATFFFENYSKFSEAERQKITDLLSVLNDVMSGELTEETIAKLQKILADFSLSDRTKQTLANNLKFTMGNLHNDAYEDLLASIDQGKVDVKTAFDEVVEAAKATADSGVDLVKAEVNVIGSKVKEKYAEVLFLSSLNSWMKALEAKTVYDNYTNNLKPAKIIELEEALAEADENLEEAKIRLEFFKTNRDTTYDNYLAALAAAESIIDYRIWVSGKQVSSKNKDDVLKDGTVSVKINDDKNKAVINLNNAEIYICDLEKEIGRDLSAGIYSDGYNNLVIKVKGDSNSINSKILTGSNSETVAGIYAVGSDAEQEATLKIVGVETDDDSLPALKIDSSSLFGPISTIYNYGIYCDGDELTISGLKLDVESGASVRDLDVSESDAIYSNGTIKIVDSDITAEGNIANVSSGITGNDTITIRNSIVDAKSGIAANTGFGLLAYDNNDIKIINSNVAATGRTAIEGSYGIVGGFLSISKDSFVDSTSGLAGIESIAVKINDASDEEVGKLRVRDTSELYAASESSFLFLTPADFSAGIECSEIYADNSSEITSIGGDATEESYGIKGNLFVNREAYISVFTGEAKNTFGILGDVFFGRRSDGAVVYVHADDAQQESYGIKGNVSVHGIGEEGAMLYTRAGKGGVCSVGLYGDLNAEGVYDITIESDDADYSYGILGNLTAEGDIEPDSFDEYLSNIEIETGDASMHSIGIAGNVSLKDTELTIQTGDVSMAEEGTDSLEGISLAALANRLNGLVSFANPVSCGINGGIVLDNSSIIMSIGKGTSNYAVATFTDSNPDGYDITLKDNSSIMAQMGDVSLSSTGISTGTKGHLIVEDSYLAISSGDADGSRSDSISSVLDPLHITISGDSIVTAKSGKADNSYAIFTLGTDEIDVSGNSFLLAIADEANDESCAILGSVKLTGNAELVAMATDSENGIAFNGVLKALENSKISLKGRNHALIYLDSFDPDFDDRAVFISSSTEDEDTLVLWKGEDLRSDDIRWITLGIKEKVDYEVIAGEDASWTEGTSTPLSVEIANNDTTPGAEDPFNHFVTAFVDNHELRKDVDYTIHRGSVIIDLMPSYLNKLSAGWHTLKAVFNNGDDVTSRFNIVKKSSGGGSSSDSKSSSSSTKQSSSVVTCQMAGYPNGYSWNEAAKACQPGYIDNNGVFHSYSTATRRNVPMTADEGVSPFYLMILMLFGAAGLGLLLKNESYN